MIRDTPAHPDLTPDVAASAIPRALRDDFQTQDVAADVLAILHRALDPSAGTYAPFDAAVSFASRLERSMAELSPLSPASHGTRRSAQSAVRSSRRISPRWQRLAVATAVILGCSVWGIFHLPSRQNVTPRITMGRDISTTLGECARVTLPDGSRLVIAPGSHVRYSSGFGASHRTLDLSGEAVFTVATNADLPFVVHTDAGASVRVLGTQFGVRAYPTDDALRVVVADGRVAFARHTVLARGDLAELRRNGTLTVRPEVDIGTYLAWADGELVFKDTPLREIVPQLERWYGVTIDITSPTIASRRLTAAIRLTSLEEILDVLHRSLEVHVQRTGHHVLIS